MIVWGLHQHRTAPSLLIIDGKLRLVHDDEIAVLCHALIHIWKCQTLCVEEFHCVCSIPMGVRDKPILNRFSIRLLFSLCLVWCLFSFFDLFLHHFLSSLVSLLTCLFVDVFHNVCKIAMMVFSPFSRWKLAWPSHTRDLMLITHHWIEVSPYFMILKVFNDMYSMWCSKQIWFHVFVPRRWSNA